MSSAAAAATSKMQQVLEINLISAQGLKSPSPLRRKLQTYAITWIDSSTKLRTGVDKIGGENPTWNDRFLFRVTPEFLASETSGVSVAIYAIGTFRDHLVGTVRFLISNILSYEAEDARTPCFSAFQIRRPSGRFYGVMNIGAMVLDGSGFPALDKISAIGYRDLMEENMHSQRRRKTLKEGEEASSESCQNSCTESVDGEGSSSSSSSPRTTTALKDWNGVRELAGKEEELTASTGFLCCLVTQRNIRHLSVSPTNPSLER